MAESPLQTAGTGHDKGAHLQDVAADLSAPLSTAAGSRGLDRLAETARAYARGAAAPTTLRAYAQDWAAFASWRRRRGLEAETISPAILALHLADAAQGDQRTKALSVATLERRLAGIAWALRERGLDFDRKDPALSRVIAGIRRAHGRPPLRKAALSAEELVAMTATLAYNLRGLRDRAILLLGFAGALRRSEIVALDRSRDETQDGAGWVEILDEGALLTLRGKTGWREVEIGRGSVEISCPVRALERWISFAGIKEGPLFRPVSRDGERVMDCRLSDKHVARLVKRAALVAGAGGDLPQDDRARLFSGHSLRAGLATHAEANEAAIQKQLGHASAEMTRRYQRSRNRFRVNLSRAAGL